MRPLPTLPLTLALLLGIAGPARGDQAADRARQHNQAAKKLFSVGLFDQAAKEYTKAYQAKPLPVFLFNLAQCHKRVPGRVHLERAVFYFKSYLQNEPGSPMREDIEGEIVRLERQLRALPVPAPPTSIAVDPGVGPPPPPRSKPIYKRWWFWTLIGAAVAGAAVGTAAGMTHSSGPGTDYGPVDTAR
jgi:hypothetical protein